MIATQTEELLHHLRAGICQESDIAWLEQTPLQEILTQLFSVFRFQFQRRRLRAKWEFGAAKSWGFDVASVGNSSLFPIGLLVPVFRHCVFISGEGEALTG